MVWLMSAPSWTASKCCMMCFASTTVTIPSILVCLKRNSWPRNVCATGDGSAIPSMWWLWRHQDDCARRISEVAGKVHCTDSPSLSDGWWGRNKHPATNMSSRVSNKNKNGVCCVSMHTSCFDDNAVELLVCRLQPVEIVKTNNVIKLERRAGCQHEWMERSKIS